MSDGILICARATENHTLDSTIDTCGTCGEKVWVSPSGQAAIAEGRVGLVECLPCATPRMSDMPSAELAPGALEELEANGFGWLATALSKLPPEEIVKALAQIQREKNS